MTSHLEKVGFYSPLLQQWNHFTQQLPYSKQTGTGDVHRVKATKTIVSSAFPETYILQSNKSYEIPVFAHLHLIFSLFERLVYGMKEKKKPVCKYSFLSFSAFSGKPR